MPRRKKVRIATGAGELRTSGGEPKPRIAPSDRRRQRKAERREPTQVKRASVPRLAPVRSPLTPEPPGARKTLKREQERARRETAQRETARTLKRLRAAGLLGSGDGGALRGIRKFTEEITRNAASEAGATVKGLPKAGYLIARDTARNIEKGDDPPTAFAKALGEPQVAYVKQKYGPLAPGGRPARETLEEIKRTPLSTALDIIAPVSVTAGGATRVSKFTKAKGGPVKRYRASKALPEPRTVRADKAEAQFPASPSATTRAMQRGRDRLSEKMGTAPSRVAKQRARQIKVDVRRRQAAFAKDIEAVEKVPRKARAATFYEAQLPKAARGEAAPTYYRGTGKGGAPLKIGQPEWDRNLFLTRDPKVAERYAERHTESRVEEFTLAPGAKIEKPDLPPKDYTPERLTSIVRSARERKVDALDFGGGIGTVVLNPRIVRQGRGGGGGLARVEADLRGKAKAAAASGRTREAEQLSIQAERVKRGREQGFDPTEPVNAIGRLEAERERIFTEAGKLTPKTAERMRGSFARELGYEDTTGAGYIGHRTRAAPRSIQRLGQTRVSQRFIGPAKTPPGIGRQRTGAAYRSGKVRADPKVAVEDWQHAQRYDFQNIARKELAKFGEPIQGRPKQGYYVLNPEGQNLPRAWKEADPRAAARAEGIDVEAIVAGDLREYIQNYIARAGSPEAAALIEKAPDSIVQVSPKVVHKFFNQLENSSGVPFGGTKALAQASDITNDLARLSLIYSNPGYLPAQWAGNVSMATAHQAFYLPGNLVRSANVLRGKHGHDLKSRILAETGAQPTSAIVSEGKSVVSRGVRKIAGGLGKAADDPWRVAAWLHEARRAGYRTSRQQRELLRKAERGDPEARAIANDLQSRTVNAMVDFDRLGPFERSVASRFLFVLPWVRGALRYPGRFALDYPGRTALAVHAAQEAERDPSVQMPVAPDYLNQAFPVGGGKFLNPRSTFTASTPLETMQTLAQAATGEGRGTLSDFLAPQYRTALHGIEGRNRFGQRVGAGEAMKQDLLNMSPAASFIEELVEPDRAAKVYGPQTRREVLRRRLGRGVIPFQIDVAQAREQGLRDLSPEERTRERAKELPPAERGEYLRDEQRKRDRANWPPEKRAVVRVYDKRQEFYDAAQRVGVLREGQKQPEVIRRAFSARAERERAIARAMSGLGRDLSKQERYLTTVGVVAKLWGPKEYPRAKVASMRRWAEKASESDLERETRWQLANRLGGTTLSEWARTLNERGAEVSLR